MKRWLFAWSILAGWTAPAWGQVARIYVTGPQVRIISGEQMQLTATARRANQTVNSDVSFLWSTSNSAVAQVDAGGIVTAGSLGFADITAASGQVTGSIRIQVLPLWIAVVPENASVTVGSQQQFTAIAYNVQGEPIPDTPITWRLLHSRGGVSTTVPVSQTGMVSANTLGFYRVQATVVYPATPGQFQRQADGVTDLTIVPRPDFTLAKLASNDDLRTQYSLKGRRGAIAANDAGQVAISASLDGLANGLFLWQENSFGLLAAGGTPGLIPGTVMYDFHDPSMDSRGNVLVRVHSVNSGAMVMLANSSGADVIVADQAAADEGLDINSIFTNRFSLSEMGDAVLRGNFRYYGSTDFYQGLFRYSAGFLFVEASARDALPGLTGRVSFDDQFGIDGKGVIYFTATAGSGRAIYRKEAFRPAVRVIGLGDVLNGSFFTGSTVSALFQIAVASGGDLAFTGTLANNTSFVARFPGGQVSSPPQVTVLNFISQLFSASTGGGVVFSGGSAGSGFGLYLWNGTQPQPLLLFNQQFPPFTGERVQDFYSATVDSRGNVFATVRGATTPWMFIRLRPTSGLLAKFGDPMNFTAPFNIASVGVPGDRTGPLHLRTGGDRASIFEANSRGLVPVLVIGDRLTASSIFPGDYPARKSASGDLYATTDQGTFRISRTSTEQALSYPLAFPDGVSLFAPFNIAVNDRRQIALLGGTNRSHQRLALNDGNSTRTLAYFQGGTAWQTPSPSGGVFSSVTDLALNEAGQVMINAQVSGGSGGLFLYNGSVWQPACVLQSCQLGGETIAAVRELKAAGNKFCAVFTTRIGNVRIDCWESGTWSGMVRRGEFTSDGTEVTSIGTFDVNRSGDIAFAGFTGLGGPEVFLKKGDRFMTVQAATSPLPGGDFLRNVPWVDLRDDDRVYFIAVDYSARVAAYAATPTF